MSTSTKRGKGTNRYYPGAIIDADDIDGFLTMPVSEMAHRVEFFKNHMLPPGILLEEDLTDTILQMLKLYQEFDKKYPPTYHGTITGLGARTQVMDSLIKIVDVVYMEACWRKLNKEKKNG